MYAYEGSLLENQKAQYEEVQEFLERYGFVVGGGWEVDHGYFDKKLAIEPGYVYLRIPAFVERGSFGDPNAILRLGTPFLLRHKYQRGNDDDVSVSVINATTNQFSEPQDPDASLSPEETETGREVLARVEAAYRRQFLQ
ncbi:hypothetical protein GCM10010965_28420 [Caldalkalibacillus thermarum]|uniref:YugN family protein n=1 Tax=Caldalkalibacillus thermarum TaxID=296745 RepID=UPI00166910B8|nr:YugN family protein [Caldalkalibacillus thermarum]GGK33838.1 hypothetical protein GCM10010965_28420 [Caldalkalibacillus thermarum]